MRLSATPTTLSAEDVANRTGEAATLSIKGEESGGVWAAITKLPSIKPLLMAVTVAMAVSPMVNAALTAHADTHGGINANLLARDNGRVECLIQDPGATVIACRSIGAFYGTHEEPGRFFSVDPRTLDQATLTPLQEAVVAKSEAITGAKNFLVPTFAEVPVAPLDDASALVKAQKIYQNGLHAALQAPINLIEKIANWRSEKAVDVKPWPAIEPEAPKPL